MQPLKVIVTGASGFLGGHVLRALAAHKNIDVIAVTRQEISDWCRVHDYSQSPAGDVLIHLAEDNDRALVAKSGKAYEEKTQATLTALLGKGYRRLVYASSAVLYDDTVLRAHLPTDPIQVDDAYTRVKRQSELIVLGSPVGVVVRLANVYGPGMSPNNVMSTILRQLPEGGLLEVMDTSPVRDFLWAEDAAEGIVALALGNLREGNHGQLYNLGTGVGTSVGVLASKILEIAGQSGRQIETRCPSNRSSRLVLDFSDTTRACGWQPRTPLQQGLMHVIHNKKGRA